MAASTGSACHADRHEPPAVLTAMGVSRQAALGAVRFSVGRYTTEAEVNRAAEMVANRVAEMRARK